MKINGKIFCQIPARAGSKRVKAKNLRYICGKPLISYAIETAINSNCFDEVYVNTDSDDIIDLAKSLGVKYYKRPDRFATDEATGDDFTADFINSFNPDVLAMISPVCPLITCDIIQKAIESYQNSECDTLISCTKTQMQTFLNNKGVNIDESLPLAQSQENEPVKTLNWGITIWHAPTFIDMYNTNKSGYLGKNRLLYDIPSINSIKISTEEDFMLAEALIKAQSIKSNEINCKYYSKEK